MGALPATAAWRHVQARAGFEVVFFTLRADGLRAEGHVTAVEDERAWAVSYEIELDDRWRTRSAVVRSASELGRREVTIEADGAGSWRADGAPVGQVEGCLDVDLEASAFTNALPVNRIGLDAGAEADAPAAYVRAPDLRIERLEQHYARLPDRDGGARYAYESPAFGFAAELAYDPAGLVVDYPGIAVRVG